MLGRASEVLPLQIKKKGGGRGGGEVEKVLAMLKGVGWGGGTKHFEVISTWELEVLAILKGGGGTYCHPLKWGGGGATRFTVLKLGGHILPYFKMVLTGRGGGGEGGRGCTQSFGPAIFSFS